MWIYLHEQWNIQKGQFSKNSYVSIGWSHGNFGITRQPIFYTWTAIVEAMLGFVNISFTCLKFIMGGTVAEWIRRSTYNRQVPSSSPDVVSLGKALYTHFLTRLR